MKIFTVLAFTIVFSSFSQAQTAHNFNDYTYLKMASGEIIKSNDFAQKTFFQRTLHPGHACASVGKIKGVLNLVHYIADNTGNITIQRQYALMDEKADQLFAECEKLSPSASAMAQLSEVLDAQAQSLYNLASAHEFDGK